MKKLFIILSLFVIVILTWCESEEKKKCHDDVIRWSNMALLGVDTVFFKYENWNCFIWVFEDGYNREDNRWYLILNGDILKYYEDNYDFWENAIDKYHLIEYRTLWNKDNFK